MVYTVLEDRPFQKILPGSQSIVAPFPRSNIPPPPFVCRSRQFGTYGNIHLPADTTAAIYSLLFYFLAFLVSFLKFQ